MSEAPETNPHRLSRQHLDILIQYMERYPRLALATARNRESLVQSCHMWEKIARTLNKLDKNVTKTGRGWSRYWADRKFKARRKYTILRKCQEEKTHCNIVLDTHDRKIVKMITDKEGNLLAVNAVKDDLMKYQAQVLAEKITDTFSNDSEDHNMNSSEPEDVKPFIHEDPIRVEKIRTLVVLKKKPNTAFNRNKTEKNNKTIEELRRDILEFELKKQKELFEIEKTQIRERHAIEMELLELKKQLLITELNNYTSPSVQYE